MAHSTATTVIIPVLSDDGFVVEALTSVLSQLNREDQIVVVDDGCTDRTRDLLQHQDGRVLVINGPRRGPAAARNAALTVARGGFIAFLDHDDLWPPGRHRALHSAMHDGERFNAAAGRIRIKVEPSGMPGSYLALDGRHAPSMLGTCLYRRHLIEDTGLFDEDMRFGEDLDYYVRLAETGMRLIRCEHDGLVYRRHGGNATNSAPPGNSVLMTILARKLARARRNESSGAMSVAQKMPPSQA